MHLVVHTWCPSCNSASSPGPLTPTNPCNCFNLWLSPGVQTSANPRSCCLLQVNGASVVTTLTISVVWIIYSMIPPYLLIHYTWIGRGTTLQFMCRVAFVLSFVTSICAMLLLWAVYPKDYDFGSATKVIQSCVSVFKSFVCTGGMQTDQGRDSV